MTNLINKYYSDNIEIAQKDIESNSINFYSLQKLLCGLSCQEISNEIRNKTCSEIAKDDCDKKISQTINFDILNFFLLTKALLSKEDNNFQIVIPDKYFKDEFFSPVLLATTIIKYQQNIDYYNNNNYSHKSIKVGDVFYLPKKQRLCYLKQIGDNVLYFDFVSKNKKEENSNISITIQANQLSKLHKLRNINDFVYNGQSGKHLNDYLNFYNSLLKDYNALVVFKRKTIIIAEQSITNSLKEKVYLPFRYNLVKNDNVPVEPLIEIFNSYQQAHDYLKENDNVDEVIIVGYQKYQNILGDLINDQNSGRFKKIILVGSKKVDDDNFKFWQWTNKEIRLLTNTETFGSLEVRNLKNEQIVDLQNQLNGFKQKLIHIGISENEAKSIVNYYINFFNRQFTFDKEATYKYLVSNFDDQENDLYIAFQNINKPSEKLRFKDELLEIIKNFIDCFISGKLNHLDNFRQIDKKYYVISENRQVESLNNYLKNNRLNIEVISNKALEQIVSSNNFSKNEKKKNVFILPYIFFKYGNPLWYYHLYNKILEFGNVVLLNYQPIENDRNEMFKMLYEKQENYRLNHADRLWFVNISYPLQGIVDKETEDVIKTFDSISTKQNEEAKEYRKAQQKKLKNYFIDRFKIKSDFNNKFTENEITGIDDNENNTSTNSNEPISKEKFKITFKDTTFIEAGEYEKFPVLIGGQYNLKYVKDLTLNCQIIADWDINLREILKLLKKHFPSEIEEITNASSLWQKWLISLYDYYKIKFSEIEAFNKLFSKLNLAIQKPTLQKWLLGKEEFFFPRSNQDLQNIIDLKLSLTPENNEENIKKKETLKISAENIKKGSTSLIHKLKRELNLYICTHEKSEILSKLDDVNLSKLLKNKEIKTVQQIHKI